MCPQLFKCQFFFVLEVLVGKLTPKGTFRLEGKVRRRVHQFLSFKYAKCFDFFLWGCDEICYRNCLFHHLWYFDNIFFYLRLFYQVKFKVSLVLLCISEWFFSSQPPFYFWQTRVKRQIDGWFWKKMRNVLHFCNTIDIPNQYHCHSFKVFSCKIIFIIRLGSFKHRYLKDTRYWPSAKYLYCIFYGHNQYEATE